MRQTYAKYKSTSPAPVNIYYEPNAQLFYPFENVDDMETKKQ